MLAQVKLYVRELYMFTPFEQRSNSSTTGSSSQEVVRTPHGTLAWVPSDRRIAIANNSKLLHERLQVVCAAWGPENDMSKHYHRGKVPAQIQFLLAQRTTQPFQ